MHCKLLVIYLLLLTVKQQAPQLLPHILMRYLTWCFMVGYY